MTEFKQNIISARFCEVLDELLSKRIVESVADFCRKIDYQAQAMSQIQKGKRDVTIDLIAKLFSEFRGSPFYVIAGIGPKVLEEKMVRMVEEGMVPYVTKQDNSTGAILAEMVKERREIIDMQKERIAELKDQIAELKGNKMSKESVSKKIE